jgi:plasmid stabilization system protein ParE
MTYLVVVLPRAKRQLTVASEWWRAHRPEATELIADELEAVFSSLEHLPERGTRVQGGSGRRMLVTPTTRSLVIYRVRRRARRVEIVEVRRP